MPRVINPRTIVLPLFLITTTAFVPGVPWLITSSTPGLAAIEDVSAIVLAQSIDGLVTGTTLGGLVQASALGTAADACSVDAIPGKTTILGKV